MSNSYRELPMLVKGTGKYLTYVKQGQGVTYVKQLQGQGFTHVK